MSSWEGGGVPLDFLLLPVRNQLMEGPISYPRGASMTVFFPLPSTSQFPCSLNLQFGAIPWFSPQLVNIFGCLRCHVCSQSPSLKTISTPDQQSGPSQTSRTTSDLSLSSTVFQFTARHGICASHGSVLRDPRQD